MKLNIEQLHITESLTRLGGVETIVKQIVSESKQSCGVSMLDSTEIQITNGYGLRYGKQAGSYFIRRRAAQLFSHAKHLVFHNFSGLMMLSDIIPHERKSLFLHTNSEDVFELLPSRLPYLDCIIVSGHDLKHEILNRFPNINLPIHSIEYPLDDCYFELPIHPQSGGIIIGYAGRLEIEQKQVTRLIDLCNHLKEKTVDFTLEIAGTGSAMEELKKQLPTKHCHFLGALNREQLHKAYQRWNYLICTSDYETGPLVAMEAMAAGVIPILPDIPCQASQLIKYVNLKPYPRGDMHLASSLIDSLSRDTTTYGLIENLRNQVSHRRIKNFIQTMNAILEQTANTPAIGSTPQHQFTWKHFIPFSLRKNVNFHLR